MLVELGSLIVHTLFDVEIDRSNEDIQKFDEILGLIIKICDKQSSRVTKDEQEELWKSALKSVLSVKQKVFQLISNDFESDSDIDTGVEEKENFRRFLNSRNQNFIKRMSEYISLNRVLVYLEEAGHLMDPKEFKQTFEDKVGQESKTEEIFLVTMRLLTKDM